MSYSRSRHLWKESDPEYNWVFAWDVSLVQFALKYILSLLQFISLHNCLYEFKNTVLKGHNEFWPGRTTNTKRMYPKDLFGSVYFDAEIWSTCAMKVWDKLGREVTDKIMITGISYTGSKSNQEDTANAVVTAAQDLGYDPGIVNEAREILQGCGYDIYV